MNKDELERKLQYESTPWWNGLPEQGALNAYTCDTCGEVIVTVDRDRGTTSAYLSCRGSIAGCKGTMASSWYRMQSFSGPLVPTYEWYRPDITEDLNDYNAEHVLHGGLLLREVAQWSGETSSSSA